MKNLHKHLTKLTKKDSVRLALTGVEFNQFSNRLNATDSCRLLSVKYNGVIEQSKVINLNTLEELDVKYPDTTRLIPKDNIVFEFSVNNALKDLIKPLTANKKKLIEIHITSDGLRFSVMDKNEYGTYTRSEIGFIVAETVVSRITQTEKIVLQGEFLRDLFQFLVDYKTSTGDDKVHMNYVSDNRPLLFKSRDNYFNYLITPFRMG